MKPPSSVVVAKMIRPYARFHNVKAVRLVSALKTQLPKLINVVCIPSTLPRDAWLYEIKGWIRTNLKGLGQKAAAHFMRNTGLWMEHYAFPLIDVHIHKALEAYHFKHSTYKEAEKSFWTFAKMTDLPVILLDAVLWCAYANNWEFSNSDFDNYGYNNKQ